ncbi:DNA cytosine methyltransferase [Aurantimonas coralicida]|uniref:DNA cytosine methyltransferase n=1 Tax=Aurantimonas coralicida TaxID=182270 RepID=UPI0039B6EB48
MCSGIEAASVAWAPLGWEPVFFSEIEKFPSEVLAHHYPDVPNLGDMTKFKEWPDADIDVLVGGTPCQSFSVAGLRKGLADPRGNLALTYLAIADRYRPEWILWENVPGVYSAASHDAPDTCPPDIDLDSGDGPEDGEEVVVEDQYDADETHALACFLAGLQELGYGLSYRTLDAQHVRVDGLERAVPQRRRRIFVVGHLGDWRRAAAVLFERESLLGHSAPRRETGQGTADRAARSVAIRGRDGTPQAELGDDVANAILTPNGGRAGVGCGAILTSTEGVSHCLNAGGMGRQDYEAETFVATRDVASTLTRGAESAGKGGYAGRRQEDETNLVAHSLRGEGFDASEDGTGRGTPIVPIDMRQASRGATMTNNRGEGQSGGAPGTGIGEIGDPCPSLSTSHTPAIAYGLRSDAGREGAAKTASADAAGKVRLRDPGFNVYEGFAPTLDAGAPHSVAHAIQAGALRENPESGPDGVGVQEGISYTLEARAEVQAVSAGWAVRRLTPTECERLQAFPDGYTAILRNGKPAADGPRYKALGNSMAVNCMRWIGQRIEHVNAIAASIKSEAA